MDEVYLLSRPLSAGEMKTVYLATGAAAADSGAPVLPTPLLTAPLDGATAARVAGKDTVEPKTLGLDSVNWDRGKGLLVRRRAYDQKASCGYLGLPGPAPSQGACMVWVRPAGPKPWDGTEQGVRRPLISLHSPFFALGLSRSPQQQLVASLQKPVQAQVAVDVARWSRTDAHHVAATWDFAARTLALFVDGRQVASTAIPGTDQPAADPTLDLWLGSDDADRYQGDCADAAFRDLRVYSAALTPERSPRAARASRCTPSGSPASPQRPPRRHSLPPSSPRVCTRASTSTSRAHCRPARRSRPRAREGTSWPAELPVRVRSPSGSSSPPAPWSQPPPAS